jgi:hypothetical protein
VLLWSSATTNTHSYAQDAVTGGQAADSWSTAIYAVRPGAMGAGCYSFTPFGISLDAAKNARYSNIYSFRGGNVATLDVLDIAGGATGVWTTSVYGGSGQLFTTGTCGAYDPTSGAYTTGYGGAYAYISANGGQTVYRFDGKCRTLEPWAQLRYAQGSAVVGGRMALSTFHDPSGSPRIGFPLLLRSSGTEVFETLAQR